VRAVRFTMRIAAARSKLLSGALETLDSHKIVFAAERASDHGWKIVLWKHSETAREEIARAKLQKLSDFHSF
jgi:hypothetical protein